MHGYEFFLSTTSAPKNRSLVQLIIYSKEKLDLDKCNDAADKFIKKHIEKLQIEFEEVPQNKEEVIEKLEKLENEETKEDIKVIYDFRFLQEIPNFKENFFIQDNICITKNNYESIDLDSYYVCNLPSLTFRIKQKSLLKL